MGTRTVKREADYTYLTCDLCNRDIGQNSTTKCFLCRKECCFSCYKFFQPTIDEMRLLDFAVKICTGCWDEGMAAAVSTIIIDADRNVREMMESWRRGKGVPTDA